MDDYHNFNYDYEKSLQTKEDEARAVLASQRGAVWRDRHFCRKLITVIKEMIARALEVRSDKRKPRNEREEIENSKKWKKQKNRRYVKNGGHGNQEKKEKKWKN